MDKDRKKTIEREDEKMRIRKRELESVRGFFFSIEKNIKRYNERLREGKNKR